MMLTVEFSSLYVVNNTEEKKMSEPEILDYSESPFCCGILEIGEFNRFFTEDDEGDQSFSKNDVKTDITAMQERGFPIITTLADYQWIDFDEILARKGFKAIAETRNPNTNRQIRTYMWLPDRKENKYAFA